MGVVAVCALTAAAAPSVTVRSLKATANVPHVVTVTYTLGEDAIVTMDVKTNGASVAGSALWSAGGDVNRKVKATVADEVRTIFWCPDATFEGHSLDGGDVSVELKAWSLQTPPDYMVVDLRTPSNVTYYASAEAVPGGVQDVRYKSDRLLMRKIPAKGVRWVMGIAASDSGSVSSGLASRALRHKVKLTHDYYFGVYQITGAQYQLINNSTLSSSHLPANWLSYSTLRGSSEGAKWPQFDSDGEFDPEASHAVDSTSWLGKLRKLTGFQWLDLPTEAQFEFAARACASGLLPGGEAYTQANASLYARWAANKNEPDCEGKCNGLATVGSYKANNWGLYDVIGNGFQWCVDRYSNWSVDGTDPFAEQVDPAGAGESSSLRAVRGTDYDASFTYGAFLPWRNGYESGASSGYFTCRLALTLY